MNTTQVILEQIAASEQLVQRLGWALAHFVWQGAAVAALLTVTLRLTQAKRPSTRYAISLLALLVMVACPIATFCLIEPATTQWSAHKPVAQVNTTTDTNPEDEFDPVESTAAPNLQDLATINISAPTVVPNTPPGETPAFTIPAEEMAAESSFEQPPTDTAASTENPSITDSAQTLQTAWSRIPLWIVGVWLLGVAALSLRLLLSWIGIRRLRRQVSEPPAWIADRTRELAKAMRVTSPMIRLSWRVTEAIAVGFVKPMVLMPAAWITELPPDMLEAVIAHELAHIRRGDLWVNLFQRIIETLLFYHPAVWWVSNRIRVERELCCDQRVIATTENPLRYAETLEHIGRLSLAAPFGLLAPAEPRQALSVSSVGSQRVLLHRVHAILGPSRPERAASAWFAGLIPLVVACCVVGLTFARANSPGVAEPDIPTEPAATVLADNSAEFEVASESAAPINTDAQITYRGRIVTDDGAPLPADLKLWRRVSGEGTVETNFEPDGTFSFETDEDRTSARFSMTAKGFAPFDSKWKKLDQPIKLTLSRGATVKIRLVTPAGNAPSAGTATLSVPRWDKQQQGTYAVDGEGVITIPRCPLKLAVNFDLLIPGFEEARVKRSISGDQTIEIPLVATKPTRLRIVSGKDRRPVAGATVHFYSRVRADSILAPFTKRGDTQVWGTSDAAGLVELTSLRTLDPVPTNIPARAIYAFRIEAPGYATRFVGDVQAGAEISEVKLEPALQVSGEIVRDVENPERISVQIRQPTVAQGADLGLGDWRVVNPVKTDIGKLKLKLNGLRAGPVDLFVTYSDASKRPNSPGSTFKQVRFTGQLTGNSSNLMITRNSIKPGDDFLKSLGGLRHQRSNLPASIANQIIGEVTIEEQLADAQSKLAENATPDAKENQPDFDTLFAWSNTAPIKHSGGNVDWQAIVLRDGTFIVPNPGNHNSGIYHKLPAAELDKLKRLLEKHLEQFDEVQGVHRLQGDAPREARGNDGWELGHQTLYLHDQGKIKSIEKWPINSPAELESSFKEITDFINILKNDAACGGRDEKIAFRKLANKALLAAIPDATPFGDEDWMDARIKTDGTRELSFSNAAETTRVYLFQPAGDDTFVEQVRQFGKRAVVPKEKS